MVISKVWNCEDSHVVDERISRHLLAKFFFSHTALVFFYGLFLFLYEIKFVRSMISPLHPVLIGWTGILVLYDIFIRNIWKKIPFSVLIFLFTVSAGITVITTKEAGVVSGIKSWILTLIPLYAFYPLCHSLPKERRENALLISFLGAALVVFAASALALGLYAIRFSDYVTIGATREFVGMRFYIPTDPTTGILLYGLYVDTNHAAIYALAFAAYGILLFVNGYRRAFTRMWQNFFAMVFGAISAVVQLCYFPLANSRGAWLALAIALFFMSFFMSIGLWKTQKRRFVTLVLSVLVSAAVTGCLLGGILILRTGITQLPNLVDKITVEDTAIEEILSDEGDDSVAQKPSQDTDDGSAAEPTDAPDNSQDMEIAQSIGDTEISFDKSETSFDGSRFLIWKEALQVFSKRPIFGTSPTNNQYYAVKYQVGLDKIGIGCSVHNSFLDLLLDYGTVGFVLLMAFWVMCAVWVLRKQFTVMNKVEPIWYMAIFITVITACASMTLSCTFINTTAMYFLMTVNAGYLVSDTE